MPSGTRGRANPDYTQTEYAQPWGGVDLSRPSSQIDPKNAVSVSAMEIRGGLTLQPAITAPIGVAVPITTPSPFGNNAPSTNEQILLLANLKGISFAVTNYGVFTDWTSAIGTAKVWTQIYTFPSPYQNYSRFGSVVIGDALYFSSNNKLGVYQIVLTTGLTAPTVSEISDHGSGSGPFIGGAFLFTVADRLCLWNIIGGDGNQNTPTPSTSTQYPDRVAWSFPFAPAFFDPNSALTPGGFQQITEARGLGTGVAVFEAVAMLAHNGGFTEMVPNTSVVAGVTLVFTFAPLWSADQGVVCRFGSMAQYGAMCYFMGFDQPYQLSPAGLNPVGDSIAAAVQNLSLWNLATGTSSGQNAGYDNFTFGLFGSLIEIEGEKHYLCAFTSDQPAPFGNANSSRKIQVYDNNLHTNSWHVWNWIGVTQTCSIYQSYDTQMIPTDSGGNIGVARDNLLLIGIVTSGPVNMICNLGEVIVGNQLLNLPSDTHRYATETFFYQFRAETPTIFIPQQRRKLLLEYENIPGVTTTVITCAVFGQPLPGGYPSISSIPITQTFIIPIPNYSGVNVPKNAILTSFSDIIGTAFTALAITLTLTATTPLRLVRVALVDETGQSDQK